MRVRVQLRLLGTVAPTRFAHVDTEAPDDLSWERLIDSAKEKFGVSTRINHDSVTISIITQSSSERPRLSHTN